MKVTAPTIEIIADAEPVWHVQNAELDAIVDATPAGLSVREMRGVSGKPWQGVPGHTLLSLSLNVPEKVALSDWQMKGWHTEAEDKAIRLEVAFVTMVSGHQLELVETLWLAADLP